MVEHVAGNSFQDLYGLRASCKLTKALVDRRSVCHFYDVLSVPCGLIMPAELLKTCYVERNPSTFYMKGVRFFVGDKIGHDGINVSKSVKYKYVFPQQIMLGQENVTTYVPEIKLCSNSI